jgi:hypothetical protein
VVFYLNAGEENSESLLIEPVVPTYDQAALMAPDFNALRDYDFHNFNYFSFEQDITDMTAREFEWWYTDSFEPWLQDVDEKYLNIDFENIYYKFNNQDEKRIFLLKIVNFVMFLLPYQILSEVFKQYEIEDSYDLQEFLKDDLNLIDLREKIIKNIDYNKIQFDSFVQTLLNFEKIAKKNLIEENINLLDDHVKKQNLFLEIFKSIIIETDMEKFRELILQMLKNDSRNILD